jgi:hypothetical protein
MQIHGYRVLHADYVAVASETRQEHVQVAHTLGMPPPYGCDLYDLSPYELDSVVLPEHSGLSHLVILLDGEAVPGFSIGKFVCLLTLDQLVKCPSRTSS